MNIDIESYDIYIRPGWTDMRKQSRSLALLVQTEMGLDPFDKAVFIFCGRSREIIKALCWDGTGWLEVVKRFENCDKVRWPSNGEKAMRTNLETILGTLRGYDMWRPFQPTRPERAG